MSFAQLTEKRRSIYALGDNVKLSEDKIINIINHSVKFTPTAFNSQSARVVVLVGFEHKRFWEFALEALKKVTPEKNFPQTEAKIKSQFQSGFGTILFFEDQNVVKSLQEQFPLYADNFPKWSLQSNGMLENVIWTALAEENIGASLQHYNPLVDAAVFSHWKLPQSWSLVAQMPFGSIEAPAGEKSFEPIEDRVKVFK